jgi:ABC-type nickel/cobalt efflux system permease component RcnA
MQLDERASSIQHSPANHSAAGHPPLRAFRWICGLLVFLVLTAGAAFSHPMGNFSINHYSKITVGQRSIRVLYLIDMAEIPTYQEMRQAGFSPKADDPNIAQYLDQQGKAFGAGLTLQNDGRAIELAVISHQVVFADGAGGLPTMKMGFLFRGEVKGVGGIHQLSYADNNFPGRAGWKEIVVLGDGAAILESSASAVDRSKELTTYSSDVLNSPPQQLSALVRYEAKSIEPVRVASSANGVPSSKNGPVLVKTARSVFPAPLNPRLPKTIAPSSARQPPVRAGDAARSPVSASMITLPAAGTQNTPRSRFTQLISAQGRLSFWVLLSAALIAAGLGALHALEPGHGKTVVAAYLVGSRGTARHAVLLGIVVTASHTAGVYLLGAVTLYASRYVVPEQLYPWLGAISGLSVIGLGIFIFLRHLTGEAGEHSHAPGEQHSHWFLAMFQRGARPRAVNPDSTISTVNASHRVLSLRELCMLGVTGGIVPCPAALVVLLSAFSLHRIGFGLFLITAFSLGLAAVLVAVGLAMVYTKHLLALRVRGNSKVMRYLPLLSSGFMIVLGAGITLSAVGSVTLWQGAITKEKLIPFVTVVLLGLFLGMRHSTDPDHVVAVSTIVSRQGSIRSSAMIGLLWGLGHTLTIFFVGSAIIIFGVVIPPRLGLSMEFCVALMLVLLGTLNLTGVLKWLTERFTPAPISGRSNQSLANQSLARKGSDHVEGFFDRTIGRLGLYQTMRPLVVGLVHGLAGSAAVALLVLSTIKSPLWSTAYLLVFGLGTMAGMMIMTTAISAPLVFTGRKFFSVSRHLTTASGLVSVAFGLFLVYHIGVIDGLFAARPHWIPQ